MVGFSKSFADRGKHHLTSWVHLSHSLSFLSCFKIYFIHFSVKILPLRKKYSLLLWYSLVYYLNLACPYNSPTQCCDSELRNLIVLHLKTWQYCLQNLFYIFAILILCHIWYTKFDYKNIWENCPIKRDFNQK